MMDRTMTRLCALLLLGGMYPGCDSPREKVEKVKVEATEDIAKRERELQQVQSDAAKKIAEETGKAVDDAKIEATKDIAAAKRVVEDAKIEATESIVEAERDAKTDSYPQVP